MTTHTTLSLPSQYVDRLLAMVRREAKAANENFRRGLTNPDYVNELDEIAAYLDAQRNEVKPEDA